METYPNFEPCHKISDGPVKTRTEPTRSNFSTSHTIDSKFEEIIQEDNAEYTDH